MNPTIWGAIVATVTLIFGALIQFGIFSFFMGKMKGVQDALGSQLQSLVGQLAGFQGTMQALQTHRAELDERMKGVEKNSDGIVDLREKFSRHTGVAEERHKDLVKRMDKVERDIERGQRTMANLASGRSAPIHSLDAVHHD